MDTECQGAGAFTEGAGSNQGEGMGMLHCANHIFQPMLRPIKYRCVKEHAHCALWPSWQRAECSLQDLFMAKSIVP